MPQSVNLSNEHLKIIFGILQKYLPKTSKVFIFGSRVAQTVKKFSDVDLAIDAKNL